jgi:hypothetical protein
MTVDEARGIMRALKGGVVLVAVSAQVQYMADKGLVDPKKMRLTLEVRREKAKELVDGGMSQRQAAIVLGIPRSTLQNDLDESRPESGRESSTRKVRGTQGTGEQRVVHARLKMPDVWHFAATMAARSGCVART